MAQKAFVANLVELYKRLVSFDKKMGVYTNGDDNNYPERIEIIINNSVTAKACAGLMRKHIIGKGFGDDLNSLIVDKDTDLTLYELLSQVATNYVYQRGFGIHAKAWSFEGESPAITGVTCPAFKKLRVGKKDDQDWSGKIALFKNWTDEKELKKAIKEEKVKLIDTWNFNKKVIQAQVKKQGNIGNYRGQILLSHPDQYVYPLAHIDGSAYNDADSEFRASTFKNASLRKGFFGRIMIITPSMTGRLGSVAPSNLSESDVEDYRHLKTQSEAFKETINDFIGVESTGGVLHIEADADGDDLDKIFKVEKIETNIDDKLFAHTEMTASKNIRKAFQNVPSILIESSDNSIFGDSGALLVQAKLFYQEELSDERLWIRNELQKVFKHFKSEKYPNGIKLPDIEPLHQVESKEIKA